MFNLTPLECILFIFVCLAIYIWTKHGRRIRRWWHDFFRQRRGPRSLRPKSPAECPACNRDCSLLPQRPKLEVLPWAKRKSRRGRPKTIDTSGHACLNPLCAYFAVADPAIHALVSNGSRGKLLWHKRWALLWCPALSTASYQSRPGWHTNIFDADQIPWVSI